MDDKPKIHLQNMLELYMLSITITLSIQLSIFVYGKLKGNNDSNKDVDKKRTHVQYHQMVKASTSTSTGSSSQASKSGYKNPLLRLITRFTGSGDGTEYQELQFNEAEVACRQRGEGEQVSVEKPETAEAGCQVCQEIIQKRERRNRAHGGGASAGGSGSDGSEDVEANESFTQDIFASDDAVAAAVAEPSQVKHTCAVCLDEDICLGSGNTTMTECGHVFHLTCLLKSLCQKNLCPMCRAPLEDVRVKQMPANILTPVSAEQLISEEISYFAVASQLQSITLSPTPRSRVHRTKEMLRVFGFTLLRTVAEYIHDANIPDGWYDDGESNDGSESSEDDNDNDNEDDNEEADNQDDNEESEEEQYDDEQSEHDDQDNGNRSDDEFNYAVRRVARVRDLRESIGN
jgi:hypothetical protein